MKSLSFGRSKRFSILWWKQFYIGNFTASKRLRIKTNLVWRLEKLKNLRPTTKWELSGKQDNMKYRKGSFTSTDKTTFPHILLFLPDSSTYSFYLTYYFTKSQLQSGDNLLLFKPCSVARFLFPLLFHLTAERTIGDSFQSWRRLSDRWFPKSHVIGNHRWNPGFVKQKLSRQLWGKTHL